MQVAYAIPDESSNVTSQLSAVKSDSRLEVVVLLQQRNANRLNLAAEIFQQMGRVSNGSRDLSVHRPEARLHEPTDTQCFARNRCIGRFGIFRVDRESIYTIGPLHDGKRRGNVAYAASQRADMEIPVKHFRPMARIGNTAMRRLQADDTR